MSNFQTWWDSEGSAMRPLENEDLEEFAKRVTEIAWSNGGFCAIEVRKAFDRATALAEQPAQQEPVAWMQDSIELYVQDRPSTFYTIPLFTTPQAQPAREPLTVDQIRGIYEDCDAPTSGLFTIAFARAIEAAHGIKENT